MRRRSSAPGAEPRCGVVRPAAHWRGDARGDEGAATGVARDAPAAGPLSRSRIGFEQPDADADAPASHDAARRSDATAPPPAARRRRRREGAQPLPLGQAAVARSSAENCYRHIVIGSQPKPRHALQPGAAQERSGSDEQARSAEQPRGQGDTAPVEAIDAGHSSTTTFEDVEERDYAIAEAGLACTSSLTLMVPRRFSRGGVQGLGDTPAARRLGCKERGPDDAASRTALPRHWCTEVGHDLVAPEPQHPSVPWLPPEKELHFFDERVSSPLSLRERIFGSSAASERWRRQVRRQYDVSAREAPPAMTSPGMPGSSSAPGTSTGIRHCSVRQRECSAGR